MYFPTIPYGEVAERSKAHDWKSCIRETVSRVRIPLSPPSAFANFAKGKI